jgi:alpha-beta hydrolase superfamily lysophospholipase
LVELQARDDAANDAVSPSYLHRVFAGATMACKTYATIPKASHYHYDQPEQLAAAAAVTTVSSWLVERGFAPEA